MAMLAGQHIDDELIRYGQILLGLIFVNVVYTMVFNPFPDAKYEETIKLSSSDFSTHFWWYVYGGILVNFIYILFLFMGDKDNMMLGIGETYEIVKSEKHTDMFMLPSMARMGGNFLALITPGGKCLFWEIRDVSEGKEHYKYMTTWRNANYKTTKKGEKNMSIVAGIDEIVQDVGEAQKHLTQFEARREDIIQEMLKNIGEKPSKEFADKFKKKGTEMENEG